MTKKKRELIEILLDNITPDNWPEVLPFCAQDKQNGSMDLFVWFYKKKPKCTNTSERKRWIDTQMTNLSRQSKIELPELCKHWNKTIVTRDEFVKRWNDSNNAVSNTDTPPIPQNEHTEETKPIQQVSATNTQIGGNHYTKLAIQPMCYSMENGLDALQHTIIKYVTRFREKAGIEDLEKAKHCIDMLIEYERNKK